MWDYSFFVFILGDVAALNVLDAIELNIARGLRELEVHRMTYHTRALIGNLVK